VLVLRYKLSLCYTPIKPDLLGFPGVFACGLCDHMITRFASGGWSEDETQKTKQIGGRKIEKVGGSRTKMKRDQKV